MKVTVFALFAASTSALQHRNSTAVHLVAKSAGKAQQTPVADPVEGKKDKQAATKAFEADKKDVQGEAEITPNWVKDGDKMRHTCEGNTMRCIYTHALPEDYCRVTGQPPWCKNYVNEPACLMVENYDLYVEYKGNDNNNMDKTCDHASRGELPCQVDFHSSGYAELSRSEFAAKDFGRWLLGGQGTVSPKGDHNHMQCEGTRGWGKPRSFDPNDGELPSCKSNEALGICKSHDGSKSYMCPSCGDTTGQTMGASHDNDITHGGMR